MKNVRQVGGYPTDNRGISAWTKRVFLSIIFYSNLCSFMFREGPYKKCTL